MVQLYLSYCQECRKLWTKTKRKRDHKAGRKIKIMESGKCSSST